MANENNTTQQRIKEAAQAGPEACLLLLLELCPDIDLDAVIALLANPARSLAVIEQDTEFETQALEQAARLLGGEWQP